MRAITIIQRIEVGMMVVRFRHRQRHGLIVKMRVVPRRRVRDRQRISVRCRRHRRQWPHHELDMILNVFFLLQI